MGQMMMRNQHLKNFICAAAQGNVLRPAEGSRGPELLPREDKPTMGPRFQPEVVDQSSKSQSVGLLKGCGTASAFVLGAKCDGFKSCHPYLLRLTGVVTRKRSVSNH
ncbi:UBX domain-containing protein 4 [Dorcoceras hygrometricum]|uniref:UBX domain-containing protein 4 n=1 Tax=Dorcoceras hygrometricum TaxID=472368 RepID=A0A2Z7ANE5_9LAMI|nr:UBX domain-containing protein 4 [Dorcoceras hygrometricum]